MQSGFEPSPFGFNPSLLDNPTRCEKRISFCLVVVGQGEKHHSSSSSNTRNNMGGSRSSIGDIAFKSLAAALGLTTIYLTATFSVNVYRGLAWHNAQTKADKEEANDQN